MNKNKTSHSITEKIIDYIRLQNLGHGDALPPERKLAEIINSSRNSLRESLKTLETRGIIEIKRGSGCYLINPDIEPSVFPESEAVKIHLQYLEARMAIEPRIIQLAIERINEKELLQLKDTVVRLSRAFLSRNLKTIINEDNRFRMILARCTKNSVITTMIKQLEKANAIFWKEISLLNDETKNIIFANYVKILNSIQDRDSSEAKKAIETQILSLFSIIRETDIHH